MTLRNVDKIKDLEHELGRYRKKVNDQQARINKLEAKVLIYEVGASQTHAMVDALMAAVANRFGEVVRDEEDEAIGFRLELDDFSVDRMMERYEVSARRQGEKYVIGVLVKEDKSNDRSD